jgi:hypothetical protein
MEFSASDGGAPILGGDMAEGILALDLKVCHEHLVFLGPFRYERGRLRREDRLPRDGEDAEVELGIKQPAWLVRSHIDTQLLE